MGLLEMNSGEGDLKSAGLVCENTVQQLLPPKGHEHTEGVDFSTCGKILGVACAIDNKVLLYKRHSTRDCFDRNPFSILSGPASALDYPHDLAFSLDQESRCLAVAQRSGSLLIYARNGNRNDYGPEPSAIIQGEDSELDFSDGVAFLPPDGMYLAACNLRRNSVSFYTNKSTDESILFDNKPFFVLHHKNIDGPDGMAFSSCGEFLALANHSGGTVSIFERNHKPSTQNRQLFVGKRNLILGDKELGFPHSVTFTPQGKHFFVTDAGSNAFYAYYCCHEKKREKIYTTWRSDKREDITVNDESKFRIINAQNEMEGGPKGIAVHGNLLTVCGPEIGIKFYRIKEREPLSVVSRSNWRFLQIG